MRIKLHHLIARSAENDKMKKILARKTNQAQNGLNYDDLFLSTTTKNTVSNGKNGHNALYGAVVWVVKDELAG